MHNNIPKAPGGGGGGPGGRSRGREGALSRGLLQRAVKEKREKGEWWWRGRQESWGGTREGRAKKNTRGATKRIHLEQQ